MIFVMILLIAGCQKDPQPQNFTDLAGTWTFTSSIASGEFTVSKTEVLSGSYTINGAKNDILMPWGYSAQAGVIQSMYLVHQDKPVVIDLVLFNVKPSVDFKSMSAEGFQYSTSTTSKSVTEAITVSRK